MKLHAMKKDPHPIGEAAEPFRLLVRRMDQQQLPDETIVSLGWWCGEHFSAQIRYTAGELRALVKGSTR